MRLTVSPELIEAARGSCSPDAMERLLEAFWPHAFRIARSIVPNDAFAEDAAQESCAVMYREIDRLRSIDAFRAWAYRIVTREALRVAKRSVPKVADAAESCTVDIDGRLDIVRALAKLPPELRAVVVLHYYAEISSTEIGAIVGVPGPTVRWRLARARRRLKTILSSDHALITFVEVSE